MSTIESNHPPFSDVMLTEDDIDRLHRSCYESAGRCLADSEMVGKEWIQWLEQHGEDKVLTRSFGDPAEDILKQVCPLAEKENGFMLALSQEMIDITGIQAALLPFASKMMTPSAFYENYPDIKKLSKRLKCPVLFVEEMESFGVGSINPIAAMILREEIIKQVKQETGITPYVSLICLDFDGWSFLNKKHFGI